MGIDISKTTLFLYYNVNTNGVMGIWNETKNVIPFWKITISLKIDISLRTSQNKTTLHQCKF